MSLKIKKKLFVLFFISFLLISSTIETSHAFAGELQVDNPEPLV
ncbi:hypothetical protein ACWOFR_03800 [Carnobacterium gallinarum]|nr:hypothetical protein [Carnobacterium gallinarum]